MCGIIWGLSKRGSRINKALLRKYRKQKARGFEGFGYLAMYNNTISYIRRETESEIEKDLSKEDSNSIMFHHRLPTSTINVEETAHPIYVSHDELDYDYYVVHNGVITNSDDLKKEHETKYKYVYNTVITEYTQKQYIVKSTKEKYVGVTKEIETVFNDSESLAIEVARNIDGMSREINTVGSVAFICVQCDKKTQKPLKVYYGHNDRNPLHIEEDRDFLWIKSVGGKDLETHKIFCYDLLDGKTISRSQNIGKVVKEQYQYNRNMEVIRSPYSSELDNEDTKEDIQYDDYPSKERMGFHTDRTIDFSDYDASHSSNYNDKVELISSDPKIQKLVERTLRLKFIRDDHLLALEKYKDLVKQGKVTLDEISDTLREHEQQVDKLTMSMVDLEVEYYNMSKLHDDVDYQTVVDFTLADFDEDEIKEFLGITTEYSKQLVLPDGTLF